MEARRGNEQSKALKKKKKDFFPRDRAPPIWDWGAQMGTRVQISYCWHGLGLVLNYPKCRESAVFDAGGAALLPVWWSFCSSR